MGTERPARRQLHNSGHGVVVALTAVKPEKGTSPSPHAGLSSRAVDVSPSRVKAGFLAQGEAHRQEGCWGRQQLEVLRLQVWWWALPACPLNETLFPPQSPRELLSHGALGGLTAFPLGFPSLICSLELK